MGPTFSAADPHALEQAGALLHHGGLLAFPTESFYGLAVRADSAAAITRLVDAKGREPGKPIALIAADAAAAERLWNIPEAARDDYEELVKRFWPGPLTLVLPARPDFAAELQSPQGIGVRVSSSPVALALARAAGGLITATSCNLAGGAPPVSVRDIEPTLRGRLDGTVDGGTTPGGKPSTLVSFAGGRWTIERQGTLQRADLASLLGPERVGVR